MMFVKTRRFIHWLNYDVQLWKLIAATLFTIPIIIGFGMMADSSSLSAVENAGTAIISFILALPLPLTVLIAVARFDRWVDATPWAQTLISLLVIAGILGGLLFSVIVHPAETFQLFRNSFNELMTDPYLGWFFRAAKWIIFLLLGALGIAIIAALASLSVRHLRKSFVRNS